MTDRQRFDLGYQAAANGERRQWCEAYGAECLRGYDEFYRAFEEGMDE